MSNSVLKFILRAVLAIFISAVLSFLLIGQIKEKTQNIIKQKTFSILNQKFQNNVIELQADFKEIEPYLSLMELAFPQGDAVVAIISRLEEIAQKTNNSQAFNFESLVPTQISENLKSVNFNLVLLGNINTFSNYLIELEKLPLFIKINVISMTGKDGLLNPSRMNIKGTIYVK